MSLAERRAPETRAAERERDPIIRAHGGEMGTQQRHRVGHREPWW